MSAKNDKSGEIDQLLNSSSQQANRADSPLLRAFEHRELNKIPDFDRLRRNIWQRNLAIEAERRRFRKIYVPLAAAAMTAIAVGSVHLLQRQAVPEENTVVAAAASSPAQSRELQYSQALDVSVKTATGFSENISADKLQIKASALSARFNFHPNAALRKVEIVLPDVVFEVIGTQFILHCTEGRSFLAVSEGTVKVTASGKSRLVSRGSFWLKEGDKQQLSNYGVAGQALFASFSDPGFQPRETIEKILSEKSAPPAQSARVSVILKSGSVISGTLISENGSTVEIRAGATGGQILRFSREEVAEIRRVR
ncbi:MAG: hypothetical protein U1F16_14080 [Turneriella sp.]